MNKKIIIVTLFAMLLIFTSCSRVIETSNDEIKMNKWIMKDGNYNIVTLYFKDDVGIFKVKSSQNHLNVKLKGLSIIDNEKISILNESDNKNYIFKYKLKGNILKMWYMDGKIILYREENSPQV